MNRCFLLLTFLVAFLSARGEQAIDKQKLVGAWRCEDEQQHLIAQYVFRADGTFTSELRKDSGELVRKLEGLWAIDGELLVYTYINDSLGPDQHRLEERDRHFRFQRSCFSLFAVADTMLSTLPLAY